MANQVYEFFNNTNNYLNYSFGIRVRAEIVKDFLIEPVNKEILDIGCGNGLVTMQFLPSNRIDFLDISEKMLEEVKKAIRPDDMNKARIINASFEEWGSDQKYDIIVAIGVLAHVQSIEKVVEKMYRSLKDDGVLIIQFSSADSLLTKWRFLRKKNTYSLNKISRVQLLKTFERFGFDLMKEVQYSFLPPGSGWLPENVLYRITRYSSRSNILSKMGSDFIWLLRKKSSD